MFVEHGIDAVPFAHEKWMSGGITKGVRHINNEDGYTLAVVDDICKPSGELIVVDVKSTAKIYLIGKILIPMGICQRLQTSAGDVPMVDEDEWFSGARSIFGLLQWQEERTNV